VYPTNDPREQTFDLAEVRGRLVVVYFWTCACPQVEQDLEVLKQLTDRYRYRGLEVVYVNLDQDPARARAFLSGRLTARVHVHHTGAWAGAPAEAHAIKSRPRASPTAPAAPRIRHGGRATQLQPAVAAEFPAAR